MTSVISLKNLLTNNSAGPQPAALQALDRAITNARLPHAILLHSVSLERIEAVALDVAGTLLLTADPLQHPDCNVIRPINKMRQISADAARETIRFVNHSPQQGERKAVLVFEADRLHRSAANAFLKTLEEPPPHTFLILLTTRLYEVLPTIRSRCLTFTFHQAMPPLQTPEWLQWKAAYIDWLQGLIQADGGMHTRSTLLFRVYPLLEGFEKLLPALLQNSSVVENPLQTEEEALAQEAGRKRQVEASVFQAIVAETRHLVLAASLPLSHQRVRQLSKAISLFDELHLLREANLSEIALLEAYLLELLKIL